MTHSRNRWLAAACLAVVSALTGCQDKLAYDRFSQVQQQASTRQEVAEWIGDPDEVLGDQWIYDRPHRHLMVLVDFDERGVVSRKQWIDANAEIWEDTDAPDPAHPKSP